MFKIFDTKQLFISNTQEKCVSSVYTKFHGGLLVTTNKPKK
jgi:hypothetical protein